MRFGICILPQADWPAAGELWRSAEEYGFDHGWTYDHLSWRGLASERWHATIPTLTAAAMVTTGMRLGTFVASPNYRHPVPFAKDIATVDQISGGRMILGLGSGGTGFDATVLGEELLSPRARLERFVDFTEALDALLRFEEPATDGGISHEGPWYRAVGARMVGAPAQHPRMPLHLAAEGPKALEFAARRGDGWVTTAGTIEDDAAWWAHVGDLARRLDDACERIGRDPASIDRTLLLDSDPRYSLSSVAAFEDSVGLAAERGFTDVVAHWPRDHGLYAGERAVLDEVASRLPALR